MEDKIKVVGRHSQIEEEVAMSREDSVVDSHCSRELVEVTAIDRIVIVGRQEGFQIVRNHWLEGSEIHVERVVEYCG